MFKANDERYKFAEQLYCFTDKTIAEIAELTSIPERTLYRRAAEYKWATLRRSSRRSPVILAEEMYRELADLTATINARPEGKRVPTPQEAELRRKILYSIKTIKKFPTHAEVTYILESLVRYSEHFHYDRLEDLRGLVEGFLAHRDVYGFASYQPEHNQDLNQPTDAELELIYAQSKTTYRTHDETVAALRSETPEINIPEKTSTSEVISKFKNTSEPATGNGFIA